MRSSSVASRPMPLSWLSHCLIWPSGLITKVPRCAMPSSSIITSKLRVSVPVGSPASGYLILAMVSEVSCQALCAKWLSVDTPYTSTPKALKVA